MSRYVKEFTKGIFKENPVFVLLLGMCPTLGVTSSAVNGLAMGLATMVVLLFSNVLISMLKKLIPNQIRIPAYIMVIATLVTVVEKFMNAFFYDLYKVLGLFIPLIVVNCIILGRAEAFAAKNNVILSFFDALGIGLGFTLSLTLLGAVREILGTGQVFGVAITPSFFNPAVIFILPPGAFITLGFLMALINKIKEKREKK